MTLAVFAVQWRGRTAFVSSDQVFAALSGKE